MVETDLNDEQHRQIDIAAATLDLSIKQFVTRSLLNEIERTAGEVTIHAEPLKSITSRRPVSCCALCFEFQRGIVRRSESSEA